MAMKEAVFLANVLYNMTNKTPESIAAVFKDYHRQRRPEAEL